MEHTPGDPTSTAIEDVGTQPVAAVPFATGWIGVAGLMSIGAGAIHAAAIGVHSEHRSAVLAFTLVAALQLGWGGLALVRSNRIVALLGALVGTGAFLGWAVAKSDGISFIAGLDEAEPIQTADAVAAGLAAATIVAVAVSLLAVGRGGAAPRRLRLPMSFPAVGVTALAVLGMFSAGTHVHAEGHGDTSSNETAAAGHAGHDTVKTAAKATAHKASAHAGAAHEAAPDPVPYDPAKPIDLGGVDGVTAEQQAEAENIVAETLRRLPQWSDPAKAEASGFRSIGDGVTGVEHFVNSEFMGNPTILDPDQPESLVYSTEGGGRRLVAAMYMLERGTPLADVPDVGGKLIQWHTHENLCFTLEAKVAGITDGEGKCPAGLVKPTPTPMVHVWIESHPCGPFAALEGIGGGTIAAGEERLCDHAHGADT
ncbi:MAG: hypothetical protein WKF43_15520 [Acidimicrobiales bacterium]